MAIDNFIPEIWSNLLLARLFNAHVAGQAGVINRDYEGEILNQGDTVHINSIGAITVTPYTKNTNLSDPETLTDATRALEITEAQGFNFAVDDIDRAQTKPKVMAAAMQEAADALSQVLDEFLLAKYVDASNDLTPATPTADTAYECLVDGGVMLDEANVPQSGRWAIVPPWYYGLLLKDDRFVGAGTQGTAIRTGVVGEVNGLTILKSNNVVTTGSDDAVYNILMGHPIAWSLAEQIRSVEPYRPEKRFADAVKGLHLYGAKVVRPTALVHFAATRS